MTSPHITYVTDETFDAEVVKSDKLVLIDFYADWCGPCKALAPTLEKIAEENKDTVKVVKVNVDDNHELAKKFGVRGIPMLVTVKDGKYVDEIVGNQPKGNIQKLLDSSLGSITPPPPTKTPVDKGPRP